MKIKQFLTITDTLAFAKGDYSRCFSLFSAEAGSLPGWMDCGEIELEVDIDGRQVAAKAVVDIEKKIEEAKLAHTEEMAYLEQTKQELLCIGNDGVDDE